LFSLIVVAVAAPLAAQTSAVKAKTPWGDPDL
jgi:hypothetical protein